jgi:hypothetical protein
VAQVRKGAALALRVRDRGGGEEDGGKGTLNVSRVITKGGKLRHGKSGTTHH